MEKLTTLYVGGYCADVLQKEIEGEIVKPSLLWDPPTSDSGEQHPRDAFTTISQMDERPTYKQGESAMRGMKWETIQQYCTLASSDRMKFEVEEYAKAGAPKVRFYFLCIKYITNFTTLRRSQR